MKDSASKSYKIVQSCRDAINRGLYKQSRIVNSFDLIPLTNEEQHRLVLTRTHWPDKVAIAAVGVHLHVAPVQIDYDIPRVIRAAVERT